MNLFSDRSFLLQALIKSHLCSRHCVSHCKQESENTRVSSFLKLIVYQKKKKNQSSKHMQAKPKFKWLQ